MAALTARRAPRRHELLPARHQAGRAASTPWRLATAGPSLWRTSRRSWRRRSVLLSLRKDAGWPSVRMKAAKGQGKSSAASAPPPRRGAPSATRSSTTASSTDAWMSNRARQFRWARSGWAAAISRAPPWHVHPMLTMREANPSVSRTHAGRQLHPPSPIECPQCKTTLQQPWPHQGPEERIQVYTLTGTVLATDTAGRTFRSLIDGDGIRWGRRSIRPAGGDRGPVDLHVRPRHQAASLAVRLHQQRRGHLGGLSSVGVHDPGTGRQPARVGPRHRQGHRRHVCVHSVLVCQIRAVATHSPSPVVVLARPWHDSARQLPTGLQAHGPASLARRARTQSLPTLGAAALRPRTKARGQHGQRLLGRADAACACRHGACDNGSRFRKDWCRRMARCPAAPWSAWRAA